MIRLTKVGSLQGWMACEECVQPAVCAVEEGQKLTDSSVVHFFCGAHLEGFLHGNPRYLDHLLRTMGTHGLDSLYRGERP
jgi:hypothetical protein